MNLKNIILNTSLMLILVSCANEQYIVGPVIAIKLDRVKKVLFENTHKFKDCLDKTKASVENQESAMLNFTVNKKGEVSKSEIETNQSQSDLARECMQKVLGRINFPAPVNATSYDVKQSIKF